ncbi:MAG TPA: leucyl aminopeptidase family protein [Gammaproteobacteria bacterium]|nr:leucyl aminopeptidase family protein [Gammaproteobacteria bacterium]
MTSKIPHPQKIEIKQPLTAADTARVDALDAVIILLPESALQKRWPEFAHSERLRKRVPEGKKSLSPLRVDLPNTRGTVAVLASYKPGASVFDSLTLARKCVAKAREAGASHLGVLLPGADEATRATLLDALVSAAAASNFDAPQFKAERDEAKHIASLTLFDGKQRLDFGRRLAEAEGNALARWLTLLPANHLTPTEYREYVKDLAKRENWKFEFLDEKQLKEIGAGAFLAVARGSDIHDAGIAHISYRPPKLRRGARAVTLVGKGICYDTGGVNLKTAKSMFGMHGDMQGSAVALGTLLALARLKVPFRVDAWLAIARNQIGPKAYTQNEVVQSFLPHVSIEVVHTDAEGRMVLADTLALSMSSDPEIVVDYATLTGSCITALGTRYSGAFTRDAALAKAVIAAGAGSGERVWPMPVDADYDEDIESSVADVKQCIIESQADHILAARFLSRFVPPACPWIHVDLSAAEHKGGLAHVPTDVTGFGVRFSLNLLLDQGLAPT